MKYIKKKINIFCIEEESLIGKFLSSDIINEKNGKIYFEAGYEIDEEFIAFLNQNKITKIYILKLDNIDIGSYIRNTLQLGQSQIKGRGFI